MLEYLSQYFDVTVYYYNPNIFPEAEYEARVKEQERLIREMAAERPVRFLAGSYEPEEFFPLPGAARRIRRVGAVSPLLMNCVWTAPPEAAVSGDFDYFTTTCPSVPLKNAQWLNDIGCRLARQYGIPYLVSDFKKKNGYKRSVELSALYGLYRQDYCGCVYSRAEASKSKKNPASSGLQSFLGVRMNAWSADLFPGHPKIVKKLFRIFPINLT